MMARPASSSLQRALRFNSMMLSGDDLGVNSLEECELDPESDASSQEDDDEHTNNTEYVEFRKVIQTPKMSQSIAERRRKSSSSSPSSKRKNSHDAAHPTGERDDEPTSRQGDEHSIERSQGSPNSNAESQFTFAIQNGDEQDIRVVCKVDALTSDDDTPVPVSSAFDLKTAPSMPMPIRSTDVIVAVEASSVSALDCVVRRGFDGRSPITSDYTPGCDAVGTVVKCGQEVFLSGLSEGERVAIIAPEYGCNARYIRVPVDKLVKVRDDIDPSEASGALLPYFIAFQTLFSGISPPLRYKAPLKGKRVLVAENTGIVGLAIASLCKVGRAKSTHIVCPEEYHEQIKSLGAVPLISDDMDTLGGSVKEKLDIIIDAGKVSGKVRQTFLKTSGRLSMLSVPPVPPPAESKSSIVPAPIRNFCAVAHCAVAFGSNRASLYDVFYSIERNQALYKSDLNHIFNLLALRRIRPKIDKFVLLQDVGECHQELEKFQQEGAIVCEPWRRGGLDNMIYQT